MLTRATLGVDPGTRGGWAVLREDGTVAGLEAFRPEMTEREMVASVMGAGSLLLRLGGVDAFVEKVGYIRGDGAQGSFTFGKTVGLIRGPLYACANIAVHDVAPAMWQAAMGCMSGGNKNVTKARALELFPAARITHATADALLIAEFGRRRLAL